MNFPQSYILPFLFWLGKEYLLFLSQSENNGNNFYIRTVIYQYVHAQNSQAHRDGSEYVALKKGGPDEMKN